MSEPLRTVLEEGQRLGFLGPGPVEEHLVHAEALRVGLEPPPTEFVDLGSGAGVPGLVFCAAWLQTRAVLLEASSRRCEFLRRAVAQFDWQDRVEIAQGRGEDLAQDPKYRGRAGLVVARSFGAPAVVAEIGSALLRLGGRLAVTEPPPTELTRSERPERWPEAGLAELGLAPAIPHQFGSAGFVTMSKERETPPRYPRRNGIPRKRPLWP